MLFTHGFPWTEYSGGMKTIFALLSSLAVLFHPTSVSACGFSPQVYARMILSENASTASNAVLVLRQLGPEGLKAILETHHQLIGTHSETDPQWQKLRTVIDQVGGQRDCHVSRLFWHTDFEKAKAEAQHTSKPILSLRLLGNLNEEFSCANSRFFRTTLYSNREVSDYLRDHFVLHWKSVRPVPRVTFDFGDGRKLEGTITGNSIHYVLDATGEVVDALPGLYGPRAFMTGLQRAEAIALRTARLEAPARSKLLEDYHTAQLADINVRWRNDLARVLATASPRLIQAGVTNDVAGAKYPPTTAAMPLALSKFGIERPMLRALAPERGNLGSAMNDETWTKLAVLHQEDAALDVRSLALIRAKNPPALVAAKAAFSKRLVEDPLLKTIQNLQRSIAEDTVRNEYLFHSRIHEWLAMPNAARNVDTLNRRVYAELFLTPDEDPWLGLAPENTFRALESGGIHQIAGEDGGR